MDDSFVYYIDMELLSDVMERLQENQLVIDEDYKEHDLKGTITTSEDDQLILTTIAYDEGWNVYVDGEKVEITKAADALIAFNIDDAGEHTVRLKYQSKAYTFGMAITLISLCAFVLIIIFEKKLKKLPLINKYFAVEAAPANAEPLPKSTKK